MIKLILVLCVISQSLLTMPNTNTYLGLMTEMFPKSLTKFSLL